MNAPKITALLALALLLGNEGRWRYKLYKINTRVDVAQTELYATTFVKERQAAALDGRQHNEVNAKWLNRENRLESYEVDKNGYGFKATFGSRRSVCQAELHPETLTLPLEDKVRCQKRGPFSRSDRGKARR